jgi:DNA-binding response OmpR family regulator
MITNPKASGAPTARPKLEVVASSERSLTSRQGRAARGTPRTLLIEERAGSASRLRVGLELDGHRVSVASGARSAFARLRRSKHDLVILVGRAAYVERNVERVRECDNDALLLAISAAGEADVVMALRLGADAYILEPHSVLETLARIHALLRRFRGLPPSASRRKGTLKLGDIELNERRRTVTKSGTAVPLSPKEFAVLVALARRNGAVAKRAELLREVWGDNVSDTTRTVDVHIAELRRKLEDNASRPRYILTEWKVGYRIASGART